MQSHPDKKKADAAAPRSLQMQKVEDDMNDEDGYSEEDEDEEPEEEVKPVKVKPSKNRRGSYSG